MSIAGNKIGTDVTGAVALGNAEDGVLIQSSSGNTIGGTGTGGRHHLGQWQFDVPQRLRHRALEHADNVVAGNIIGTDATGTKALGNGQRSVADR